MNDSPDKHSPSDDFVDYLARDTMRRLRHEARFGPPPGDVRSRSRIPTILAIAAGVVMTLSTGMVLGASANYASAEVLPNGTTTIPSRPALAILPIKNALTAIGCTQTSNQPVATAKPAPVAVAAPSQVTADRDSSAQVVTPTVRAYPDRAQIAAYARQYQSAVVRGDTVSDYIVMALDASHNYVWSTNGSGNVMIAVGVDTRTAAERAEYNRVHAAEFESGLHQLDAQLNAVISDRVRRGLGNTAQDSQVALRVRRLRAQLSAVDSSAPPYFEFKVSKFAACERFGSPAALGNASGAVGAPSFYTSGWTDKGSAVGCNQTIGMQQRSEISDSGISGLSSANVAAADIYTFAAGELAPRELRVMVVQLAAGTTWNGR